MDETQLGRLQTENYCTVVTESRDPEIMTEDIQVTIDKLNEKEPKLEL